MVTETNSTFWASLGASALGSLTLAGPVALRGSLGFLVPLARPEFVIQDLTTKGSQFELHRPYVIAGRASLGVEVRFP
jgi:hypothetical protein